jgi:hypothetical protein
MALKTEERYVAIESKDRIDDIKKVITFVNAGLCEGEITESESFCDVELINKIEKQFKEQGETSLRLSKDDLWKLQNSAQSLMNYSIEGRKIQNFIKFVDENHK